MSAQLDVWRVSTDEGIFETDLETLRQWIAEGCVLPTDKVSKGSLNWIDAGRAPMLKAAFRGELYESGPPKQSVPEYPKEVFVGGTPNNDHSPFDNGEPHASEQSYQAAYSQPAASHGGTNACYHHPGTPPDFICRNCSAALCRECPKFVSKIPLCPLCGELCKPYEEVKTKAASMEFQSSGFGFDDFGRALRYPFQHKIALLFGALMYGLLLLGGFRTGVIAYVILFGCMSHVISQVAWGRLNRSFMPDFSSFSPWDDLVCPIFLGIGITIVTWGPSLVLIVALIFGVVGSRPDVSQVVAGQPPPAEESVGPTQDDLAVLTDPNADPNKLVEANQRLNEIRPANQITREAERSKAAEDPTAGIRMLLPYLGAGILILGLFLLTLAWAIFYYPMALAVAGYTQSFGSVINPLVGLDTIRRMGGTYFKAFAMVLMIQLVAFVISVVVGIVTSPFSLPFIGNLPAKFIDGTLTFYFNLVISCLLGLALFKCADRLGISVD